MWEAVAAWRSDPTAFAAKLDALVAQPSVAMSAAETAVVSVLDRLWAQGWTPADLVHAAARELSAGHRQVCIECVQADGHRRRADGQAVHPQWQQQLDGFDADTTRGRSQSERLRFLVEVVALGVRLGDIPPTMPPPGGESNGSATETSLDPRMLGKVRALLAQAESTTFEEEAEAFTAKAQELIARYAIDEAAVHTVADVGEPSVRRLYLDAPYIDAKATLLAEVAGANRCRVVLSTGMGWVTAFGYDHDLDAVQLLATSLLAQATRSMVRHGARRDGAGRSRTRSFRRAFLLGFAQRIGQRLRDATDGEMATTPTAAQRFMPVLAARDDRLREAEARLFPGLVQQTTSASNATGWWAGQAAADLADLDLSGPRLGQT